MNLWLKPQQPPQLLPTSPASGNPSGTPPRSRYPPLLPLLSAFDSFLVYATTFALWQQYPLHSSQRYVISGLSLPWVPPVLLQLSFLPSLPWAGTSSYHCFPLTLHSRLAAATGTANKGCLSLFPSLSLLPHIYLIFGPFLDLLWQMNWKHIWKHIFASKTTQEAAKATIP